jgi:hypothetical protein
MVATGFVGWAPQKVLFQTADFFFLCAPKVLCIAKYVIIKLCLCSFLNAYVTMMEVKVTEIIDNEPPSLTARTRQRTAGRLARR